MIIDSTSMELQVPRSKIKKIRTESRNILQAGSVSERGISPDWENDFDHRSNPTSPIVLQEPPERCFLDTVEESSELRCSLSPIMNEQGGTGMVDRTPNGKSLMKWQRPDIMIESDASLTGWGATNPPNRMTHFSKDGSAGVKNGIQIPLLTL